MAGPGGAISSSVWETERKRKGGIMDVWVGTTVKLVIGIWFIVALAAMVVSAVTQKSKSFLGKFAIVNGLIALVAAIGVMMLRFLGIVTTIQCSEPMDAALVAGAFAMITLAFWLIPIVRGTKRISGFITAQRRDTRDILEAVTEAKGGAGEKEEDTG